MIIAMCPVDTSKLPQHPDVAFPVPSIEHTLHSCESCGCECWIGPRQLAMRQASDVPVALCYACVFSLMGDADPHIVALNPDADEIPRRT